IHADRDMRTFLFIKRFHEQRGVATDDKQVRRTKSKIILDGSTLRWVVNYLKSWKYKPKKPSP
ncbi:MAG: hypothetical protein ACR2H1_12950, partial [Limisphaerales bacterium]